jgi:histidyl-tRNA synthetase
LKGGMKAADKSGARFSLVLGEDELDTGRAEIKNMQSGATISVTIRTLQAELIKELKKSS